MKWRPRNLQSFIEFLCDIIGRFLAPDGARNDREGRESIHSIMSFRGSHEMATEESLSFIEFQCNIIGRFLAALGSE